MGWPLRGAEVTIPQDHNHHCNRNHPVGGERGGGGRVLGLEEAVGGAQSVSQPGHYWHFGQGSFML